MQLFSEKNVFSCFHIYWSVLLIKPHFLKKWLMNKPVFLMHSHSWSMHFELVVVACALWLCCVVCLLLPQWNSCTISSALQSPAKVAINGAVHFIVWNVYLCVSSALGHVLMLKSVGWLELPKQDTRESQWCSCLKKQQDVISLIRDGGGGWWRWAFCQGVNDTW